MKNRRELLTDWCTEMICNTAALVLVLFVAVGCSTTRRQADPQGLLLHRIPIPSEFAWGKSNPHFDSGLSIWIDFYDRAWWQCVEDFARNIDYLPTIGDYAANGGGASVGGYAQGYSDAKKRIEQIKRRFGKVKAQEILQKALEYPQ
ncbi:MAG TPA: hypothetical protein VL486_15750 [Verrucomicrobiae bacterium]|nr:hypothetical protein [Verrucomicrobiae bacterium]